MKKTKISAKASKLAPIKRPSSELSYEDAVEGLEEPRMTKVSVTVDRGFLALVDHYVQNHAGTNRSEIFDRALEMWAKETQKQADRDCYGGTNGALTEEEVAWSAIQMEAVKYIW